MRTRYLLPVFLGAFLLFQMQPIVARRLLPWFGGSPSVWTTCMLFFQVLLLAGYGYSHLIIDRLRPGRQVVIHTVVLGLSLAALAWMATEWKAPILPSEGWKPATGGDPVLRIIGLLAVAVGLPYLVLSTTSPLLQAWFSMGRSGESPYRLYTVSNVGSVLALVSYPFVVEPLLALRAQAWMWAAGYVLFALGVIYCALGLRAGPAAGGAMEGAETPEDTGGPPDWKRKALWVGLPALSCMLFLAVTNELCSEVAVIPFLWILPLALYLLSFILCFYSERGYWRPFYLLALIVSVGAMLIMIPRSGYISLRLAIGVYSAALFICCMVCHGELAALRPAPRHLTSFYLALAAGGALGGVFVGVIAPFIFSRYWELELGLILCWGVGSWALWIRRRQWSRWIFRFAVAASIAAAVHVLVFRPTEGEIESRRVTRLRNFYGVLKISEQHESNPNFHRRVMVHGRTIHGLQYVSEQKRNAPTAYYGTDSGVGITILSRQQSGATAPDGGRMRVGVTGLGVGTLAAYGRPGDTYRFYEINPDVIRLAEDRSLFTYLSDSPADLQIVLGDARMSMERELRSGSEQYDVLVLDAFSGDAIPAHLLTREAFLLYLRHLKEPDGVIAINVTNRVLNLRPVVLGAAEAVGLGAGLVRSPGDGTMTFPSEWLLLTRDTSVKAPQAPSGKGAEHRPESILWTDDFHPLLPILR